MTLKINGSGLLKDSLWRFRPSHVKFRWKKTHCYLCGKLFMNYRSVLIILKPLTTRCCRRCCCRRCCCRRCCCLRRRSPKVSHKLTGTFNLLLPAPNVVVRCWSRIPSQRYSNADLCKVRLLTTLSHVTVPDVVLKLRTLILT